MAVTFKPLNHFSKEHIHFQGIIHDDNLVILPAVQDLEKCIYVQDHVHIKIKYQT